MVSDKASQDRTTRSLQGKASQGDFSNIRSVWEVFKENRWVWALILLGVVFVGILVFAYGRWISHQYGFEFGQGGVSAAGEFGDTFGALTAFFTGAGFVGAGFAIFSQLQYLRWQEETQTSEENLELLATTMTTVTTMESFFDADRMRKLRCVTSSFFLNAVMNDELEKRELREEVAEFCEQFSVGHAQEEFEEFAVRDVLNYLETVAHFTNHDAVDDDLVLSVFHSRMRMYFDYASKYFPPIRDSPDHSLVWIELKKVCKEKIERWLNKEYEGQGIPPPDRPEMYTGEMLLEQLKREHLRCKVRL